MHENFYSNSKPWNPLKRYRVGDVVENSLSYFMNRTGVNSILSNRDNWIYIGEVLKDGNFAFKNGSNLTAEEAIQFSQKIGFKESIFQSQDKSILIENDIKNIESNVSFFIEEFNEPSTTISLSFTAIQIIGVYDGGLKLNSSEYALNSSATRVSLLAPRKHTLASYFPNTVEIQYTHLKTDL